MSKPHPAVPGPVEVDGVAGGSGRRESACEGVFDRSRRVGVRGGREVGVDDGLSTGELGYGVGDRSAVTRKGEGGLEGSKQEGTVSSRKGDRGDEE
jgi:hypothetical protein